jgi:hypothetical protein
VSRATVRQQVLEYLQNANVTHLSTIKPFPAKFTPEMEFYAGEDPGHSSGAIMYLYIESEAEHRIAFGGSHNGRKAVEYSMVLDCFLRSTQRKAEDAGYDNESFLDSLITAIRADRTAGTEGKPFPIFQWGEGTMPGASDITVTSYYPRQLSGGASVTQIYSSVRVTVVEILDT